MTEILATIVYVYLNSPVHGVSSMLNSATGTPFIASIGANPAAGYTTDDVPTCVWACKFIIHFRREFYWHFNAQAIANNWLRYCTLSYCYAVASGCLENGHERFRKVTRKKNKRQKKTKVTSACTELQILKCRSECNFHFKCTEIIENNNYYLDPAETTG